MESESNTEQRILEAAEHIFLEEGFAGARMQQIADRAGINKAMLHYYFRSKDKLFELVFNYKMRQFIPQITQILARGDISFLDKLDQFVLSYIGMLRKNPSLPLFIITTMSRNPDFAKVIKIKIGKDIIAVMREEMKIGTIRAVDPHQFMLTLIGMCIFPFLGRPVIKGVFDLNDVDYDQILAERHIHVMQFARSILAIV